MQPIQDLINKIKYSQQEDPEDYLFYYLDRLENQLKELTFDEIEKIEDNFLLLKSGTNIPLHRIKRVKKKGKIIWER